MHINEMNFNSLLLWLFMHIKINYLNNANIDMNITYCL